MHPGRELHDATRNRGQAARLSQAALLAKESDQQCAYDEVLRISAS